MGAQKMIVYEVGTNIIASLRVRNRRHTTMEGLAQGLGRC